jgi:hypothetical protein
MVKMGVNEVAQRSGLTIVFPGEFLGEVRRQKRL